MKALPANPGPAAFEAELLDFGGILRGASSLRVERPGSRYSVTFLYANLTPAVARDFLGTLQRGLREGIEAEIPLLEPQGLPGTPVVDGAGQSGTQLAVRGFNAGYAARKGYFLTLVEADGTAYLHTLAETSVASSAGTAVLQIDPPLRAPFADGDRVELLKPFVQGFLVGESFSFQVPVNRLVSPEFVLEEYQ